MKTPRLTSRRNVDAEPLRAGFAVSRLFRVRRAVARHPFLFMVYFTPIVLGWTLAMSYGAALFGANQFAVQFTPQIALYTIALGMLVYPTRLLWVPTLVFAAVFAVPMFLPLAPLSNWQKLLVLDFKVPLVFLLLNTVAGVVTGFLSLWAFGIARRRLSPERADLLLAFIAEAFFMVTSLLLMLAAFAYMTTLPPEVQYYLGFDEHYMAMATKRILRGCTVMLVFFLIILQRPTRHEFQFLPVVVLSYVALALLHQNGFVGYAAIDAGIVGLLLTMVIPAPIAPLALASGVAVYAAITGEFLRDAVPLSRSQNLLEIYSIVLINLLACLLARNTAIDHREQTNAASIKRLNAARDFADVGIFVVNQNKGVIQLDATGMRVMGMRQALSPIQEVYSRFDPEDQKALAVMGIVQPGQTQTLTLRAIRGPDDIRSLHVYIWAEYSESGAKLAYGLVLDITDQQKQEDALRHTLEQLEEKDEKQRRMFSIISHEIRTPASVLSMLIDDLPTEEKAPQKRKLREAADQLLGVLTDMRQAVNPDQNLAVNKVPYFPNELAETVRNTYQTLAQDNRMQIVLKLGKGAEQARIGDQMRIKQLVGNLVRNALIHSRGRKVEIMFDCHQDAHDQWWSRWTVRDDGIGIDPKDVERLFEPFERGGQDDPRNRADGSGLGLYIVKTAARLLGGDIEFIETGRGACYTLEIPEDLSKLQPAAPVAVAKIDGFDFKPYAALLVEDSPLVAEVMLSRLQKVFGSVVLARNGREALNEVARTVPDIMITDLFMPEMEGDELITALRGMGYTFPMVGLTAAAVGNDMDRFVTAGAGLVLSKPADMQKILGFAAERLGTLQQAE